MGKAPESESWYDIDEDWPLIEASLAKQYGIRIRQVANEMSWSEFSSYISSLMPDTPLGQIVSIRAEKDPKVVKGFTADQKRIHNEWLKKQANKKAQNTQKLESDMQALEKAMAKLFG